jgi:hypothetical protein
MISEETRSTVLGLLNRLYVPVTSDDLALCLRLVSGVELSTELLEELAAKDHDEFDASLDRAVWICPALEFPSGAANPEFFTRSDWPTRTRVVHDVLSVGQELMLLRQFCDIAMSAVERGVEGAAGLELLLERIDDLAIHLPGQKVEEMRTRRELQDDNLTLYRELAEDLYGDTIKSERQPQRGMVSATEKLALAEKYFGSN